MASGQAVIWVLLHRSPQLAFRFRAQTMRRWLTFRNILILVTNIIFLIALILRSQFTKTSKYQMNQMQKTKTVFAINMCIIAQGNYLNRFLAHQNNQCRDGDCPYEENKMAFIGYFSVYVDMLRLI